jgi:hypothetical protein
MKTTSPVNSNITFVAVQSCGAFHTASGANSAEFEKAVEDGAVVANIVAALFL